MPKKEYTCTACPKGCTVEVEFEGDKIIDVSGYECTKGEEYARNEFHDPRRIVTTTARISGAKFPRLPVRTRKAIPKGKINCCLKAINELDLIAPVELGQVLIEDVCDTGVSVVATRSLGKEEKAERAVDFREASYNK